MAKKLNTHVHAHRVEKDEQGRSFIAETREFGPDDELPDWAVKSITNPNVWAESDEDDASQGGPASLQEATTARQVMAWVGSDAARAREALDAENAREGGQRSTLVADLQKVAGS